MKTKPNRSFYFFSSGIRKSQMLFTLLSFILLLGVISSCKKKETEEPAAELDAQTKQFNDDANSYKSESDEISDDINNYVRDVPEFGRVASGLSSSPICGVTIDSSQLSQKILIFNFDGITPCSSPSRTRAGQIKVQLTSGAHWSDPGAVLTETFINYKVVRLSDNKSITINGVKKITNVNGNNWLGFIAGTAKLKYRERAYNVQVTFGNGQSATWNTAHTTEWSYVSAIPRYDFKALGDTSMSGFSNVSAWGINRYGQSFTTHYNSALLSNTYCGLWRPNAGELVHHVNNSDFTLTLGVNQQGNPTTLDCAYGYKVTWTNGNQTASVILSY